MWACVGSKQTNKQTTTKQQKMKISKLRQMMDDGACVLRVEYRASVPDHIKWRDKETKTIMEANILSHNIETCEGAAAVSERVEEGSKFDPTTYQSPFKKGESVALLFKSVDLSRGKRTFYGVLERIEPDEVSSAPTKLAGQVGK